MLAEVEKDFQAIAEVSGQSSVLTTAETNTVHMPNLVDVPSPDTIYDFEELKRILDNTIAETESQKNQVHHGVPGSSQDWDIADIKALAGVTNW